MIKFYSQSRRYELMSMYSIVTMRIELLEIVGDNVLMKDICIIWEYKECVQAIVY